jgi:hypothetical protein
MKKWGQEFKEKMKNSWKRLYHYTHKNMTRGAENIAKMWHNAHKEECRKNQKNKKNH